MNRSIKKLDFAINFLNAVFVFHSNLSFHNILWLSQALRYTVCKRQHSDITEIVLYPNATSSTIITTKSHGKEIVRYWNALPATFQESAPLQQHKALHRQQSSKDTAAPVLQVGQQVSSAPLRLVPQHRKAHRPKTLCSYSLPLREAA